MNRKINTKLVIHLLLHQAKDFEMLRDENWSMESASATTIPMPKQMMYKGRAEAFQTSARLIHQLRTLLEEGDD